MPKPRTKKLGPDRLSDTRFLLPRAAESRIPVVAAPSPGTMLAQSDKFRSWIPQGFDYLSPEATERLLALQERVRHVFRRAGYSEVTPPSFDYSRTFRLTTRDTARRALFETRDVDGENLAVRSDLTVQVIKAAANGRFGSAFPLRLCYVQPVFQDHPHGSGRRREVVQAGVEEVGQGAPGRVTELLALARTSLSTLGREARILFGDARFLNRLLQRVPSHARAEFSAALYSKDTTGLLVLCQATGLTPGQTALFCELPLVFGGAEALARLQKLCANEKDLLAILEEARAHEDVVYDFSMVRELSYYSGPVFEAYVAGETEPLLSGGVYDDLFQQFGQTPRPACGFAVNLSLLL